ncbi:maleylpyruvate isomerase family mycothiol-dependent enzyme [Actinomycetospora cinnamomea]|uniref:Uncharacterized protein (TIGR03083 family) n=1 Tax=Actinomycetospora cinnamomea TaxID=663609 RepID=A0A2U1FCQ7_9PSEU|nr:maleylpyruvate isomerase family mycothiol-dependent enzyme [Actinomycetospora cinnamomea]PVZ09962.1 uncharacterized protein (TIGR03083 family) [Actinomycetospora cinnamomea]
MSETKRTTADTWDLIATERRRLHEALVGLDDAAWSRPALCEGWTTKDTLAHIVSTLEMTPPRFVLGLARSGFSFPRMVGRNIQELGAEPVASLLARLERGIHARTGPPGPTASWLVETVAHGEDIAHPTGTTIAHDERALRAAADTASGMQPLVGAQKRIAGLRLRATDTDWSVGDGPEVSGPLRLLVLAMVGRPPVLDELAGDGVAVLRERS